MKIRMYGSTIKVWMEQSPRRSSLGYATFRELSSPLSSSFLTSMVFELRRGGKLKLGSRFTD